MIYFLHGLNGFADEWQPMIHYFSSKGFHCTAIELRKGMNLRKTRFQDYVDKIVSLVEKEDILVGHSMGGLLVQKVAEATVLKAGIGICPAPPKGIKTQSLSYFTQIRYLPFIIARLPFLPSFSLFQNQLLNNLPLEIAKKRYQSLQKQSAIVTYEVLKQKIPVDETKIRCPLFFIARANDLMISPSIVQQIAEKYNAPMKTISGSHYIFSDSIEISKEIYEYIQHLE
jgi:pimeloyl-ACP methyl ester carboxylesterase